MAHDGTVSECVSIRPSKLVVSPSLINTRLDWHQACGVAEVH